MKVEILIYEPREAERKLNEFISKVNVVHFTATSEVTSNNYVYYTYHILYTDKDLT